MIRRVLNSPAYAHISAYYRPVVHCPDQRNGQATVPLRTLDIRCLAAYSVRIVDTREIWPRQ
jgi:hypothetical protein